MWLCLFSINSPIKSGNLSRSCVCQLIFHPISNPNEMSSELNYICCFGEVLWDLLPSGKVIGGAPFNVAAHLNNLGLTTHYISRVGNDELGNEIKEWLEKKTISTEW